MEQIKRLVVHLRTYEAGQGLNILAHNQDGSIKNKSSLTKLTTESMEWSNYLKRCRNQGFLGIDVDKAFEITSKPGKSIELKEVEVPESIKQEVKDAFYGKKEDVILTPEQETIKELQAQVKALMETKTSNPQDTVKRTRRTKEEIELEKQKSDQK